MRLVGDGGAGYSFSRPTDERSVMSVTSQVFTVWCGKGRVGAYHTRERAGMNRLSYKELLFDERKDREEQLRWIKDAVNGSAKFYREPPYSYEEELAREIMQLHTRIAELEAENDQLTAHSDIERQDDKSPNDTQSSTIVYRKESEE